ncbi:hypothetical protein JCM19233_7206 [Vibrio astriarenae]|nr:hypothetical protein JCM19233_7206 [Vibrio sp. C7]
MSSKIDNQLFSAHEHALEHEACPKCQESGRSGELELRNGKHGAFLGCNQYPQCDYIRPLHQNDGHIVKHLGVACLNANMSWCCAKVDMGCLLVVVIFLTVTT